MAVFVIIMIVYAGVFVVSQCVVILMHEFGFR